jgi:hypothetical protein
MGGFGGMGGGMFGFGGFMGGGLPDRAESAFSGQLTLYGQRGIVAPLAARMAMWRSLSTWGFLSVLASHVHRSEYAPVRGHSSAAADLLLHLVRVASGDSHGDLLLGVFSSGSSSGLHGGAPSGIVLKGLLHGACWPKPGVDYAVVASGSSGPADPAFSAGYCSGGEVPERQRECMRVVAEVVRISFLDTVPAPADPNSMGGMGGGPMQLQRMVENKLARAAPIVASTVVAALPQIGFALCRVNAALNPAAVGGGRRGSAAAIASGAAAFVVPAKKKRSKKKKGANGGISVQTAGAAASTTSAPSSPTAANDDEDEEDAASTPAASLDVSSVASQNSPALCGQAIGSSLQPLQQPPAEPSSWPALPATPNADERSVHQQNAGGFQVPPKKLHLHPGHDYPAPFGLFRLAAAQLLSSLVQVSARAADHRLSLHSHSVCASPTHSATP